MGVNSKLLRKHSKMDAMASALNWQCCQCSLINAFSSASNSLSELPFWKVQAFSCKLIGFAKQVTLYTFPTIKGKVCTHCWRICLQIPHPTGNVLIIAMTFGWHVFCLANGVSHQGMRPIPSMKLTLRTCSCGASKVKMNWVGSLV